MNIPLSEADQIEPPIAFRTLAFAAKLENHFKKQMALNNELKVHGFGFEDRHRMFNMWFKR